METKNQLVRRLVSTREYKKALQICKDWNYDDPTYQSILSLGYECLLYPKFYSQLGYDTNKCYQEAINILCKIYN